MLNAVEDSFSSSKHTARGRLAAEREEVLRGSKLPHGQRAAEKAKLLQRLVTESLCVITPAAVAAWHAHTCSFYAERLGFQDL
jgi:hypothetical protein